MAAAWLTWRLKGAPGVLWLDPDIVADPDDHMAMLERIDYWPDAVWVALHKLWPASTGRAEWCWGHGRCEAGRPELGQEANVLPGWFAMGMTYTPASLLNHAAGDLPCWEFGQIDMSLSTMARQLEIPIRVAHRARPKHLHYLPRAGDMGYRPCS